MSFDVAARRTATATSGTRGSGLSAYVLLAFGITWLLVAPIAASHQGWIDSSVSEDWHAIGAFGPFLAAVLVSRRLVGGLGWLWSGLGRWRVSPWFYAAAFSPALFAVPAAATVWLADGDWPSLSGLSDSPRLADRGWVFALLVPAIAYGIGEEVGWRGFALPRLQARMQPLLAGLVLGVIWVGWHVPFYLYRDGMVDASVGEHRGVRHGSRDRGDRLLVASHVDNRDGCGDGMTTTIGEGVTLLPALVARRAYRWQYPGGIPRSWARP